jgi:hypothetical protein
MMMMHVKIIISRGRVNGDTVLQKFTDDHTCVGSGDAEEFDTVLLLKQGKYL